MSASGSSSARRAALALALSVAACDRCGGGSGGAGPSPAASTPSASASAAAPPSASASGGASAGVRAFPPKDLDVLLITIDCLRADMPWAGYPRAIAPRLTELAKQGVVYTNAYALSSYTSMSVGGLLSGRMPGELDRDGYFFGTYGEKNLFFPELLQKAGIRTLSAHAHGYFKGTGLAQGFDAWEVVPDLKWNNTTDENVTSPQLEAIAEKLLSDPALEAQRFFAWFHFVDPHDQYVAHEGIDWGPKLRDRYDAEVTFTDKSIGKLIDFVRSKPYGARTAIVVTADHGEAFGEHRQYMHGFELWEPLIRVPLFVVAPGLAPRDVTVNRSAVDLAPTILDLFGLPAEPTFLGKSLRPDWQPGAAAEDRDLLVDLPQTSDNDRRRALVSGKKKLIAYGPQDYAVAYDLEADPEEAKPIMSGPMRDELIAKYKALTKDLKDVPPTKCKEGCLAGGYAKANADAGGK